MNGQWIGRFSGSNSGQLVIDLDDMGSHFEGYVYAYDDNLQNPSTYAYVSTKDKTNPVEMSLPLLPIDSRTNETLNLETLVKRFPASNFPKTATVQIQRSDRSLNVSWKTDVGTYGSAELPKSKAEEKSELKPLGEVGSWSDFRKFISTLEHRRYIFRGQPTTRKLRTSFHRTGRADLLKFITEDAKTLHRHLSSRTKHVFDLTAPEQNGAFYNLVQHHGYPTPLLDWTFSPYVGAFFAYRQISKIQAMKAEEDKIRLFVFDQKQWRADFTQIERLVGRPHFSLMEFIAIDNERLVPQQSISSVTNVDDIESYIRLLENSTMKTYLRAIDLPMKERSDVMKELSTMGITAGSMFPGLDGACEELKERFFQV